MTCPKKNKKTSALKKNVLSPKLLMNKITELKRFGIFKIAKNRKTKALRLLVDHMSSVCQLMAYKWVHWCVYGEGGKP